MVASFQGGEERGESEGQKNKRVGRARGSPDVDINLLRRGGRQGGRERGLLLSNQNTRRAAAHDAIRWRRPGGRGERLSGRHILVAGWDDGRTFLKAEKGEQAGGYTLQLRGGLEWGVEWVGEVY